MLTLLALGGLVAALLLVLRPRGVFDGRELDCMNNVRNLTVLLDAVGDGYPDQGGANLLLFFVVHGEIPRTEDHLRTLFCPGDTRDTWAAAGGIEAYRDLDLSRHDLGSLTSYAGRDLTAAQCAVRRGHEGPPVVLVCDDSADHHAGGYVVGLSDGTARWRDQVDDWHLARDVPVAPGPASPVPELRCLRAD